MEKLPPWMRVKMLKYSKIVWNLKLYNWIDLRNTPGYKNHGPLKKISSIDAIITERCGPPCIRLASSSCKKIYFYSGDIQDVFMKLLEGELKPATEDDALKFHGMHRNK